MGESLNKAELGICGVDSTKLGTHSFETKTNSPF